RERERTATFYVGGRRCTLGRESNSSVILGLAGQQLVAHLVKDSATMQKGIYPRHFGLVFTDEKDWQALADRAKAKGLKFFQEPRRRYPGHRIEHQTFFLEDPSRNLLEFKYYRNESAILAERGSAEIGDLGEPR